MSSKRIACSKNRNPLNPKVVLHMIYPVLLVFRAHFNFYQVFKGVLAHGLTKPECIVILHCPEIHHNQESQAFIREVKRFYPLPQMALEGSAVFSQLPCFKKIENPIISSCNSIEEKLRKKYLNTR